MKNLFLFIIVFTCGVSSIMAQGIPSYISSIDNASLQGWWPFEGNATNQVNSVGAQLPITPALTRDRLGLVSSAYNFVEPGGNQEQSINIPTGGNNFLGSNSGFTINTWVQLNLDAADSSGVVAEVAEIVNDVFQNGWRLEVFGGDSLRGIYRVNASNEVIVQVQTDLYNSEILAGYSDWHMISFTADNSGARLYVDGQNLGNNTWSGIPGIPNNNQTLNLGCSDAVFDSLQYNGKIDDVAIWSRSLTTGEIGTLFAQSPAAIAGCTNTNACNYLSNVTVNDGTCKYECTGCIDPAACNYNDNATIYGFCDYSCIVDTAMVVLFLDANTNGVFDPGETTIEGWPVRVTNEAGDDTLFSLFSNDAGMVMATAREQSYRYRADFDENNWFGTTITDTLLTFSDGSDAPVYFGFAPLNETPGVFWEHVPGVWTRIDCVHGYGEGVYLQNTGGTAIFGIIELTTDTLLLPGADLLDTTSPDSSSVGYAAWTEISIPPGERELFTFHAVPSAGPLPEGDSYSFNYHIQLFSDFGPLLDTILDYQLGVNCGAVTDEIIAEPAGYETPHYILDSTRIHYRIVFELPEGGPRNLEGDTLRKSIVKQNLNTSFVDLTTLDILFSTTNAEVHCLHDDGTMDLLISDANLVSAETNPLQSFILLEYTVQLRDNLAHNDSIVQVFTLYGNTSLDGSLNAQSERSYRHTIFDCNSIVGPSDTLFCVDEDTLLLNASQEYVESYLWFDSGISVGEDTSYAIPNPGEVIIIPLTLQLTNPLCVVERNVNAYVYDYPFFGLGQPDGSTIVAPPALSYEWYFVLGDSEVSDSLIEGANSDTLLATRQGQYYCIMRNGDCEITSETVTTGIDNISSIGPLNIYPNPFSTQCTVVLPDRGYSVSLYDATGRIMRTWSSSERQLLLDRADLSSGIYILRAQKENNAFATRLIIE